MEEQRPRLRTVEKYEPPYRLNQFPPDFLQKLGQEMVFFLMTRRTPRLEGNDWEEIFARLVCAQWKPSNVGLDDIVFEQCAWGAKTVKARKPSEARKVRLISGRNPRIFLSASPMSGASPRRKSAIKSFPSGTSASTASAKATSICAPSF
jgi:hypothetical protein